MGIYLKKGIYNRSNIINSFLLFLFFLSLHSAHSSSSELSPHAAKESPKKSVLQRIAEKCRKENNCPDYILKEKEIDGQGKLHSAKKKKTVLQRIKEQCPEGSDCPAYNFNNSSTQTTAHALKHNTTPPKSFQNNSDSCLGATKFEQKGLITEFYVKETAGLKVDNYPVSVVIPLVYGQYQTTENFYLLDQNKIITPSQIEVLNRWWGKDNSIRHILVHFNSTVEAFNYRDPMSGIAEYALYNGQNKTIIKKPIQIHETNHDIHLSNGLIKLNIAKKPLTITTPAGQLVSILETENGKMDYSFNHEEVQFEIEESGPVRSVVKISSLTKYVKPKDIKHGWALRIYMYANSDKVKVDFQLQNSAINTAISAPLYFKGHTLRIEDTVVSENSLVRANKMPLADIENLPLGVIHADNVNVMLRNFWQTFPNGLSASTEGKVDVELWPSWSKQFHNYSFVEPDIYWLDDMQQTYKEILLDFSGQDDKESIQYLAKLFQYPPVAIIPQSYYAKTKVTVSYDGAFPISGTSSQLQRTPVYPSAFYKPTSKTLYRFGMGNFGLDRARRWSTGMAGGWPYSQLQFFVSGNPTDFYNAQDFAQAELNYRPQWLSGYRDASHYDLLTPSTNPYSGNTWRRFKGHSKPTLTRNYIAGTSRSSNPRDDQHAWFYHVEHAYLMSGNKWIKDWYEFMAEFKQIYLLEKDPYPDRSHRAEGEALAIALSAYKYTGNKTLEPLLENYIEDVHNKYVVAPHNIRPDPQNKGKIAAFQLGYLLREFIGIYTEFPKKPAVLKTIGNYINWNYEFGQFSYYKSSTDKEVSINTSSTALSLVDPVIWFATETQQKKYADHAIQFVEVGLNGKKPYGKWSSWVGQFEASMYRYYKQNTPIKTTDGFIMK